MSIVGIFHVCVKMAPVGQNFVPILAPNRAKIVYIQIFISFLDTFHLINKKLNL